jgi:hypothetical protein
MIIANFTNGYDEITTDKLSQWDYGQKLGIYGLNLQQITQVHFGDKSYTKTIVRLANAVGDHSEVIIPDCLLENEYDVHAFIYKCNESYEEDTTVTSETEGTYYTRSGTSPNYTYTAVTLPAGYVEGTTYYKKLVSGQTVKRINIPVLKRKQPEEFISHDDPTELSLLQEAVNAVNSTLDTVDDKLTEVDGLLDTVLTYSELHTEIQSTVEAITDPIETSVTALEGRVAAIEPQSLYDDSVTIPTSTATEITLSKNPGTSGAIEVEIEAVYNQGYPTSIIRAKGCIFTDGNQAVKAFIPYMSMNEVDYVLLLFTSSTVNGVTTYKATVTGNTSSVDKLTKIIKC